MSGFASPLPSRERIDLLGNLLPRKSWRGGSGRCNANSPPPPLPLRLSAPSGALSLAPSPARGEGI